MRNSRLSKNTKKRTQKTIFLSIIGIILVLFVLFKFGLEFLVNLSIFLTGNKNEQSVNSSDKLSFIPPPNLDPILSSTNSARIVISGKSENNMDISLYFNGKKVDEVQTEKDGKFKFDETLSEGNNEIKAKATYKDKESDFSNTLTIFYSNKAPKLEISSPSDGQSFKRDQNNVNVSGKTDLGVIVTVNGFYAVIDDNNNFSYNLPLQNGDNTIKVVAVDQAGNKSEKEVKVNYSP